MSFNSRSRSRPTQGAHSRPTYNELQQVTVNYTVDIHKYLEFRRVHHTVRKICMRFNIQECEANMHYRYLNLIYIGVLNLILYVYIYCILKSIKQIT